MTTFEQVKRLLKDNVDEINMNTCINELSIEFKDDEFYVKKNNEIVFEDKISNYNISYESQKKFITEIVYNTTTIFMFVPDKISAIKEDIIIVDNINCFDVLGYGDIYDNILIKINFDKISKNHDNDTIVKNIIEEIKGNLNENKIRAVYCKDKEGFFVNGIIEEDKIEINYIEEKKLNYKSEKVTLFYMLTTIDEITAAIKFVKNLSKS